MITKAGNAFILKPNSATNLEIKLNLTIFESAINIIKLHFKFPSLFLESGHLKKKPHYFWCLTLSKLIAFSLRLNIINYKSKKIHYTTDNTEKKK